MLFRKRIWFNMEKIKKKRKLKQEDVLLPGC